MNRRQFLRTAAGTGALAGGLGVDAALVEPYNFQVTRFPVHPADPDGHPEPLRFAFMSDFHRSLTTSRQLIRDALALCQAEKPDVVLLGGDYITGHADLIDECAEDFRHLKAPRGVFFVLGNHDHWAGPRRIRETLRRAGLQELTNTSTRIGADLHLVGIDDCWAGQPDVKRAFRGTKPGMRLVVSHNPRIFPAIRDRGCTAICGHTHGGQVNIPFVPNPFLEGWTKYVKGWWHEGDSSMYVNRGIGMLALPFRFRCRPEITILIVSPSAARDAHSVGDHPPAIDA